MTASACPVAYRPRRFLAPARAAIVAASLSLAWASPAFAYIGDSFLSIPGTNGHWKGAEHKGWIRAEASDWVGRLARMNSGATDPLAGNKLFFGGPNAPRPGAAGGKLTLALSKGSPDLAILVAMCAKKTSVAEMGYAEDSDRARPLLELGARPKEFPNFWEYKLKNVQVVDCPVAAGAEQQAFTLAFGDIEWLNYDPKRPMANAIVPTAEEIGRVRPAESTPGKSIKSFLITWVAPATDAPDEACPKLNTKPTEADVFRYMTPEQIAAIKKKNGEKGVSYGGESEKRGPGGLSTSNFPGTVPPPEYYEPQTPVAFGIDLDGTDGKTNPPSGIRKHAKFTSPDGRPGVDNQLLRVWGCVTGYRGKRGYNNQTPNARRADGNITTLIEMSNISDARNDDDVYVALIHSMDKPVKDNSGKIFIANYTYRPTDNPNFALFNMRVHGKLRDGVFTSDVIPEYTYTPGQGAPTTLYQARIRLEPQPDGSVRGFLAGYQDYRKAALFSGYSEGLFNFQAPGVYYAMKRNADGLKDPITGEYNGISTVFEMDTVPAFLTSAPPQVAQDTQAAGKSR